MRVCAWHIDFDERPTCWLEVDDLADAVFPCANLQSACGWSVDYATAYGDTGALVAGGRPY